MSVYVLSCISVTIICCPLGHIPKFHNFNTQDKIFYSPTPATTSFLSNNFSCDPLLPLCILASLRTNPLQGYDLCISLSVSLTLTSIASVSIIDPDLFPSILLSTVCSLIHNLLPLIPSLFPSPSSLFLLLQIHSTFHSLQNLSQKSI